MPSTSDEFHEELCGEVHILQLIAILADSSGRAVYGEGLLSISESRQGKDICLVWMLFVK